MQLNQCVRSQGMMGIFRQGEPFCAVLWQLFHLPCVPSCCACDGEMGIAQQKGIHLCGGDLSLSDYDNSLKITHSIHLKWTFIPPRYN